MMQYFRCAMTGAPTEGPAQQAGGAGGWWWPTRGSKKRHAVAPLTESSSDRREQLSSLPSASSSSLRKSLDLGKTHTNYAYRIDSGYDGLLLHALSPRLAELVYPYVATQAGENLVGFLLLTFTCISSAPLLDTRLPLWWTRFSWFMYIPSLHRTALIDLRVLRLLLRQFDTCFLFGNSAAIIWTICSGTFSGSAVAYGVNNAIAGFTTYVLDAIRTPPAVTFQTAVTYAVITSFWAFINFYELGNEKLVDYHSLIFGDVRGTSVFVARMATVGFFFLRYSFNLWLRPHAYVVLRRPLYTCDRDAILLSRYNKWLFQTPAEQPSQQQQPAAVVTPAVSHGDDGDVDDPAMYSPRAFSSDESPRTVQEKQSQPPPSPSPSPLLPPTDPSPSSTQSPTVSSSPVVKAITITELPATAAECEKAPPPPLRDLLIYQLTPGSTTTASTTGISRREERAAAAYRLLTHRHTETFLTIVFVCVALVAAVPLFAAPVPIGLAHLSVLLHLPSLQRLLLTDLRLLPLVALQFDCMWLVGNTILGLLCLFSGLCVHPAASAFMAHVLLSVTTVLTLDSIHLSSPSKVRASFLWSSYLLFLSAFLTLFKTPYFDYAATYHGFISAHSFFMGSLFMLSLYTMRYATKLWHRPGAYIMLYEPLPRNDTRHLLLSTLRFTTGA